MDAAIPGRQPAVGEPLSAVLYRAADRVRDATLAVGTGKDLEWAGDNGGMPTGQVYDGRDRLVAADVTQADIAWIEMTRPTIGPALEALLRDLGEAATQHETDPTEPGLDDLYCHDELLGAELAHALLDRPTDWIA